MNLRGAQWFSGLVCTFQSVVLGLNPKHAIYPFSIYSLLDYICQCIEKRTKMSKKEAGVGPHIFKRSKFIDCRLFGFIC